MDSTLINKKHKKQKWKYVEIRERDLGLFKAILMQKFLKRDLAIKWIFKGDESYAAVRLRKLKMFSYLKGVQILVGQPESYLLLEKGVEALRSAGYPVGAGNLGLPAPQSFIELSTYEHDFKVAEARFLFETMEFCKDWKSEKMLKMGTQGEKKVPDGFFTRNGRGIAVEVELHPKKSETYRKIFEIYEDDPKVHYIFYLCGGLSLMRKIMKLTEDGGRKVYCFALYENFIKYQAETVFKATHPEREFKIKAVIKK